MQFHKSTADFFVPDGNLWGRRHCHRTTHLCISAHQDISRSWAYHGVAECFGRERQVVHRRGVTTAPAARAPASYAITPMKKCSRCRVGEQRFKAS